MPQRRPISFVFFAIFNFAFALFFVGCGVCANISDSAAWHVEVNGVRFDEKTLRDHLNQKLPGHKAIKITGIVLGYGTCVGLILSGIAMLFGGLLSKLFALLVYAAALVHHIVLIVYQLVWVNPAIDQFFSQIPVGMFGQPPVEVVGAIPRMSGYISVSWWFIGCLFYMVAAPVVLFSSTSSSGGDVEMPRLKSGRRDTDEEDEDDDRPRRRSTR
jgi:hypothetical protein